VAKLASFQEDNAKQTGRAARSVRRDATRAKRIPRIADTAGRSICGPGRADHGRVNGSPRARD
jgi:hypothetical protein